MQIFFSYGHDYNVPIVYLLRSDLQEEGYDVWIDNRNIHSGDDWRRAITDGIMGSDTALSFASTYALRNPGVCLSELSIAVGVKGAQVQTVLLERGVKPPSGIMFRQALDMRGWFEHVSSPGFLRWYEDWRERLLAANDDDERASVFMESNSDGLVRDLNRMLREDTVFMTWYGPMLESLLSILKDPRVAEFAREIGELRSFMQPDELNTKQRVLEEETYSGRAWLKQSMVQWMESPLAPKILLITGAPGVGKSSFVAHEFLFDEHVGAAVYCEWNNEASNSPECVARSIAYQLACRYADYRLFLLNGLRSEMAQQSSGGSRSSKRSAFERYVVDPINHTMGGDRPITVILIDGLDELDRVDAGRGQAELLPRLLASYASMLPSWLRFVVTCRRNSAALAFLRGAQHVDIDETGDENRRDVREYVALRLRRGEDSQLVESVLSASAGVFLHASLLCDELVRGWITEDQVSGIPFSLGDTYRRYFKRMFADADENAGGYCGNALRGCYEAISVLATFSGAIPLRTLGVAAGWERPELDAFVTRCSHFLAIADGKVSFMHKSIPDWLQDDSSKEYRADAGVGWRALAIACYTQFDNGIAHMNDFELMNLIRCVDEARMSCRFGTTERTSFKNMLEGLLRDSSLGEALLCKGKACLALRQYGIAETYLRDAVRVFRTRSALNDGREHAGDVDRLAISYRDLVEAIDLSVRLEESIDCCNEGIVELREIGKRVGENTIEVQRGVGKLLLKRSYVYYRMGGHEQEYVDGYWEAYGIFSRIGDEKLATEALWRLGIGYRLNGNMAAALDCSGRVEETIDMERYKHEDPEFFCFVRTYQGDFHVNAGLFKQAEQYLLEAEKLSQEPWVKLSDVRTAQLNLQLSSLYYNLGRYEEAEPRAAISLRLQRVVYGEKSVESCNGLNQLGFCLLRQGKVEDALASFQESYRIRNELYTHENPFTMVSLRNCGLAHMELGGEHLATAKAELTEVLAVRERLFAKEKKQMRVAETLLDLSHVCLRMGNAEEALDYALRAEYKYKQSFDSVDDEVRSFASCYTTIGEALLSLGRVKDARGRLERAVELYSSAYGEDSTHHNLVHARKLLERARGSITIA